MKLKIKVRGEMVMGEIDDQRRREGERRAALGLRYGDWTQVIWSQFLTELSLLG